MKHNASTLGRRAAAAAGALTLAVRGLAPPARKPRAGGGGGGPRADSQDRKRTASPTS